MASFIAEVTSPGATLCLMKGRATGDTVDEWMYNYYDNSNIPVVEQMVGEHGHPLLYEAGGFTICVPQFHLVPELQGRVLGWTERNRLGFLEGHDG